MLMGILCYYKSNSCIIEGEKCVIREKVIEKEREFGKNLSGKYAR